MLYLAFVHLNKQVRILIKQVHIFTRSHLNFNHFLVFILVYPWEETSLHLSVDFDQFHILIFSSETTGSIATKLWWNGPWMAPFQNCVR